MSTRSAKVLQSLGQLHIITGVITVSSGTWTLVTNDVTTTLSDIGAGSTRLNFGLTFNSAPHVCCTALKPTHEATVFYSVMLEAVTTTTCLFQLHHDTAGTNTTADPDDTGGWHFIVIGTRNN